MARTRRIKRKELFAPDEFVSFSRQAATYLNENRNTVIMATAGALLLLVAVVAFQAINSSRETSAAIAYQAGVSMMADKQYQEAAAAFGDVVTRYGGTSHGVLARLQRGHALLQADRAPEAVEAYESFLSAGPPADYLRQLAQTRLAGAQAVQGDAAAAQTAFAAAAAEGGIFAADALLGEAQAADAQGDTATAKQLYQRFLEEYPASSRRPMVTARLVELGGAPSTASQASSPDSASS